MLGTEKATAGAGLSHRERSVLELLVDGLTNRAIAERLGLSEFYVRNRVSRLLIKVDVNNRTELAAAYMRGQMQAAQDAN